MRNRLAKIEISQFVLKNGISAQNMEDLFFELPKGTEIVNFAEDYCRCVKQITVRHEKFKELEEGCEIPQIKATFTKDEDGVEDCELDFTGILEDGYKVEYDDKGVEMVVVEDNLTFKVPSPYEGYYTITMGKSWIQEARSGVSSTQRGGIVKPLPFKLPEGYQVNCPVIASSDKKDSQENYGWWSDDDIPKFPWEDDDKKEKCDHKWKKITGINKYYVVCEICDKRNKEEEERINAK